ncbi:MAG: hypothetical protein GWO20_07880, partial [Candidatus Korarchaeota archaeon]|nr:hypothetical protein [Candidatus Korarchaeota archaeon]NIW13683.1 hypothetical protein [Candidatus Thorarchaeota archaeon]
KLVEIFKSITKELREYGERAYPIPVDKVTTELLDELEVPKLVDIQTYARAQFNSYKKGR